MDSETTTCECGCTKWKANGVSNPVGPYAKKRFRCTRCGTERLIAIGPASMRLRPLDALRDQDREAIQFAVLRYSWADVQEETGVKPQTVKRKLREIWKNRLW